MEIKNIKYENSEIFYAKVEISLNELENIAFESLSENDKNTYGNFKSEQRKKEWLAIRYIINKILRGHKIWQIKYSDDGRPFFDYLKVSISHSADYVAVMLSNHEVGVDIQQISDKTLKITRKFLSDTESNYFDVNNSTVTTLLWSIKETVYKLNNKRGVDFARDILIEPFDHQKSNFCCVKVNDNITIEVNYQLIENYWLSYSRLS